MDELLRRLLQGTWITTGRPINLVRADEKVAFVCSACTEEHISRMVAVDEDRNVICTTCYDRATT